MPRVAIDVMLKSEILDPEGRAVEQALPQLGYAGITDVRVGKHLELHVDADGAELARRVDRLCAEFLTNPVIETFDWHVVDTDAHHASDEPDASGRPGHISDREQASPGRESAPGRSHSLPADS